MLSLFQREFSAPVLAAILTILGYSINDSIVVMDRVRENLALRKKGETFGELVNRSINETLSRTVNTVLTTILPVLALLILGGDASGLFLYFINWTYRWYLFFHFCG